MNLALGDRQLNPYLFRFLQSQGPSALPFAQTPALLAIAYNILNARW
ncbi:hypothetical protein IQ219_09715 [Synechocystis sp. LEGE 06083]|nr:hypothetical protein [Synechocystis sp. LEGE 06083]MBE9195572.1 hypothetical protein [Synechocystis sp. LEGE 06083]